MRGHAPTVKKLRSPGGRLGLPPGGRCTPTLKGVQVDNALFNLRHRKTSLISKYIAIDGRLQKITQCVNIGAGQQGAPGSRQGLPSPARCFPREKYSQYSARKSEPRGGVSLPCSPAAVLGCLDDLAAGLQVEIDGKGGHCASMPANRFGALPVCPILPSMLLRFKTASGVFGSSSCGIRFHRFFLYRASSEVAGNRRCTGRTDAR